jgi:hypothetical protein
VAASNALVSILRLESGARAFSDLVWLAASLYLLVEQFWGWRTLTEGRPAGSLLGALVRPVASVMLRTDSRPGIGTRRTK